MRSLCWVRPRKKKKRAEHVVGKGSNERVRTQGGGVSSYHAALCHRVRSIRHPPPKVSSRPRDARFCDWERKKVSRVLTVLPSNAWNSSIKARGNGVYQNAGGELRVGKGEGESQKKRRSALFEGGEGGGRKSGPHRRGR